METRSPIVHPTNRVWPGSPDNPMPTLREAYEEGVERGRTWPRDQEGWRHVPGGPMAFAPRAVPSTRSDPCHALCMHSCRVREKWLAGWRAGFIEAHRLDIPSWYR